MEQYSVWHDGRKPRNRCESVMIGYIQALLANPVDITIEQIREWCLKTASNIEKSKGTVSFSEIRVSTTVVGNKNWVGRQFEMFGTGRKLPTISIHEKLLKDADNGYSVVICNLNDNLKQ